MIVRCTLLAAALVGCESVAFVASEEVPPGGEPTEGEPTEGGVTPGDTASVDSAEPATGSRCTVTPERVWCTHETAVVQVGLEERQVHWQVPVGEAPELGWPVAVVYQGSFFTAELSWDAAATEPIGMYHQARLTQVLLDRGFAVITPETHLDGATYWDTNVLPWAYAWESSADHELVVAILAAVARGDLGPLDTGRLYATGISSGGYMTSRMAVSYPGTFRALAIQSASYATCIGAVCVVPELTADHPPTLFLHGELDLVVPITTVGPYLDALGAAGVPVDSEVDPSAGHEWLEVSPERIADFFGAW